MLHPALRSVGADQARIENEGAFFFTREIDRGLERDPVVRMHEAPQERKRRLLGIRFQAAQHVKLVRPGDEAALQIEGPTSQAGCGLRERQRLFGLTKRLPHQVFGRRVEREAANAHDPAVLTAPRRYEALEEVIAVFEVVGRGFAEQRGAMRSDAHVSAIGGREKFEERLTEGSVAG
jgi:hypothetical protein